MPVLFFILPVVFHSSGIDDGRLGVFHFPAGRFFLFLFHIFPPFALILPKKRKNMPRFSPGHILSNGKYKLDEQFR